MVSLQECPPRRGDCVKTPGAGDCKAFRGDTGSPTVASRRVSTELLEEWFYHQRLSQDVRTEVNQLANLAGSYVRMHANSIFPLIVN